MTLKRTAFWCGAGLTALLGIAALAVALAVYQPQRLRPLVERAMAPRGGSASLAGLQIALSPPALTLSGLAIAGPPLEGDLLRLDHLRVEPKLERLFRGGPWLKRVEARGVVFERRRPRETEGPPDLTPLTRLFDIEDLSVTDARLRLAVPQGDLAVDGVSLSLTPGEGGVRRFGGGAELTFRRNGSTLAEGKLFVRGHVTPAPAIEADMDLASARLDLPWLAGDVSGRTALRVTRKDFQVENLRLTLPDARVRPAPRSQWSLRPLRLTGAAGATLDGREPRLEVSGLDLGGLLTARGRLSGRTLAGLSGAVEGNIPRVERVMPLLTSLMPGRLEGIGLAGELPFHFTLAARGTERVLALELRPREIAISLRDAGVDCRLAGTLRAAGPLQGWLHARADMTGRLQGTGHVERPPLSVRRFRLDAPLAGEIGAPALPGWRLSAGAGDVLYEGRPLPLGALELQGSATAADGSLRVEELDIRSETLGRLTGELAFDGGGRRGSLNGHGLPAAALTSLAGALTGRAYQGWSPAGAVDVAARLEPADGGPRVAATAALQQFGFSSPAGDVMGQNLAGRLDVEARLSSQPRLTAVLAMGRGEALWGAVYVDFARDPLELRAGLSRVGPDDYKDLLLDVALAGSGRVNLTGEARRTGGSWRHRGRLLLSEARLGPIFRTFLREPLAASHPALGGMQMDGTARMDLTFAGSEKAAELNGRLTLQAGDLRREGEPPVFSGLEIDLPIAYSLGGADPARPAPSHAAGWGRFRLKEFRLAGERMGPLEMPVVLVSNRLHVGGEIEAPLFGARLLLRRIRVDEPLSPAFRIHLAARLDGLDLARLSGKGPALEGRLGGLLDPVLIARERVTAVGKLTGELFGGRMEVGRVTLERPFHPGQEIGADVKVDGLDLERLSAALNIGRITGRISGSLDDLRIAYGQPVAFRLKMESVPAKGVAQRVSLKAVNSISLLSTGSALGGLGVSVMTTFFRDFPYAKIGIECGLKNDVFLVRGLIREDGVEYLVKRPFLRGINVINRNPDNRIGFSDMMERARRVTAEGSREGTP